ncbi:MAG: type II secretion system F family protein [Verrucomicrobia bacterium]|nr:type II secretion system F family protein [Verrucomicrobiota bacterium]
MSKTTATEFRFTAVEAGGGRRSGTLSALDRSEALRKLKRDGLQPVELSEVAPAPKEKEKATAALSKTETRSPSASAKDRPTGKLILKPDQVVDFTEEFADLLAAGIPMDDALVLIERRKEKSAMRDVAAGVALHVNEGKSLAEALRRTSTSFGDLYCALVAAGEASGSLGQILRRHAAYLRNMRELKGKVQGAMIYPSFLVFSGLLVMVLFVSYLLPRLAKMLESQGAKLPPPAALLMAAGGVLKTFWPFLLIGLILLVLVLRLALRSPRFREAWDRAVMSLPGIGALLWARFHVQFTETFSGLLKNGLTMQRAMTLCQNTTSNQFLRQRISTISELVSNGSTLANAFEKSEAFPPSICDMVRIGEHTGQLPESLGKAAERLDRDLTRRMETIGELFQPVIILVLALVVGGMAWIMMGSVFETISRLQNRG